MLSLLKIHWQAVLHFLFRKRVLPPAGARIVALPKAQTVLKTTASSPQASGKTSARPATTHPQLYPDINTSHLPTHNSALISSSHTPICTYLYLCQHSPGAGWAGITSGVDHVSDGSTPGSAVLCKLTKHVHPVLSPSCVTEHSRSGDRFQVGLDRGCPRLQLASSSSAPRARRCGKEKILDQSTFGTSCGMSKPVEPSLHEQYRYTVRFLTHVLCKPTHFFFHSFIATMSYPLQTSFIGVMKGWADKFHVWGTPKRSPSRSNSR